MLLHVCAFLTGQGVPPRVTSSRGAGRPGFRGGDTGHPSVGGISVPPWEGALGRGGVGTAREKDLSRQGSRAHLARARHRGGDRNRGVRARLARARHRNGDGVGTAREKDLSRQRGAGQTQGWRQERQVTVLQQRGRARLEGPCVSVCGGAQESGGSAPGLCRVTGGNRKGGFEQSQPVCFWT